VNVGKTVAFQVVGDENDAAPGDGRINDRQVVLLGDDVGVDRLALRHFDEGFVDVLADAGDVLRSPAPLDFVQGLDLAYFDHDVLIVRGHQLAAVVPVGFIAIVLFGVVGCGNDDAAMAMEGADGEGKLGRGAKALEEKYLDAVGRHDVRRDLGELAAVVPAVVGDGHADLAGYLLPEVIGIALGRHPDGVLVHPVGAGAHDAAQATRPEFQGLVEGVVELVGVVLL